ncbi:unnamed protein product [Colias eurytheme]|nr:unnamed protein product [Colias eurytheme]
MDARDVVKMTVIVASMGALLGYSYGLFPSLFPETPQNKPMHMQAKDKRNDGGTVKNPVRLDNIVGSMKEN